MFLDISDVCGKVDVELATFIHNIILVIKIAVPIVLVFFGMLDLAKGVIASKEDEMKKGQHNFITRLIAGVVVFLMVAVTQLVISIVDKDSNGEFWKCANAIMNGEIKDSKEEYREYNKIDAYCCKINHGEMNENNICVGQYWPGYNACTENPPAEVKE